MIARLRTRHRRTWWVLVFVVPAIIVAAWSLRRAPAVMDRLPAELLSPAKR